MLQLIRKIIYTCIIYKFSSQVPQGFFTSTNLKYYNVAQNIVHNVDSARCSSLVNVSNLRTCQNGSCSLSTDVLIYCNSCWCNKHYISISYVMFWICIRPILVCFNLAMLNEKHTNETEYYWITKLLVGSVILSLMCMIHLCYRILLNKYTL